MGEILMVHLLIVFSNLALTSLFKNIKQEGDIFYRKRIHKYIAFRWYGNRLDKARLYFENKSFRFKAIHIIPIPMIRIILFSKKNKVIVSRRKPLRLLAN